MTIRETAKLLGAISRYYPKFKSDDKTQIKAQIIRYNAALMDYDFKLVCLALLEAITTMKYPPTAIDIKELADKIIKYKGEADWGMAWQSEFSNSLVNQYVDNLEVSDEEIYSVVNFI